MRADPRRQDQAIRMSDFQVSVWDVALAADLSDLELLTSLTDMIHALQHRILNVTEIEDEPSKANDPGPETEQLRNPEHADQGNGTEGGHAHGQAAASDQAQEQSIPDDPYWELIKPGQVFSSPVERIREFQVYNSRVYVIHESGSSHLVGGFMYPMLAEWVAHSLALAHRVPVLSHQDVPGSGVSDARVG